MGKPWEKYQAAAATAEGPWTKYAAPDMYASGNVKRLTGGPGVAPKPKEGYASSHIGQSVYGLNEGIADLVGLPTTLGNMLLSAGPGIANKVFGTDMKPLQLPDVAQGLKDTMSATGVTQPATDDWSKNILRRTGQQVGASLLPIGRVGTLAKEAGLGVASGLGAGVANQVAPGNPWADLLGQGAGFLTAAGAAKGARRLITPFPADAGRVRSANYLQGEGVDLTAGQKTGSKKLQYLESELGGESFTAKQGEQFTKAALRRVGINANRASVDVMDDAFTSIGGQFDDLAARNTADLDTQLRADLEQVWSDYESVVPETMRSPIVKRTLDDLLSAVPADELEMGMMGVDAPGMAKVGISGKGYQALVSRIAALARKTKDNELRGALYDIRHALDGAMERSIAKNNPADLGAWQQARTDYRNLLTLEDAVARAGPDAAAGIITPANLRSAVQRQGKRAYVRGKGDFNELAHAGAETMTPLPNSGTAGRLSARGVTSGITGTIGALTGGAALPGIGHVAGMAAGLAVPSLAGAAALSRTGRGYLGNQLLGRGGKLPKKGLATNAALAPERNPTLQQTVEKMRKYNPQIAALVASGAMDPKTGWNRILSGMGAQRQPLDITVNGGS